MTRDENSQDSRKTFDTQARAHVADLPGGLTALERILMLEVFVEIHGNLSQGSHAKWLLLATVDYFLMMAEQVFEVLTTDENVDDWSKRAELIAENALALFQYSSLRTALNRLSDEQCRALLMGLMRDPAVA